MVVSDKVLYPEDFEHYILYEGGEYRFSTQDRLFWSFGSGQIHPDVEEKVLEAISAGKLVLEIRVVSSIPNPVSQELAAIKGASIPAYHWTTQEFLGDIVVEIDTAPRPAGSDRVREAFKRMSRPAEDVSQETEAGLGKEKSGVYPMFSGATWMPSPQDSPAL